MADVVTAQRQIPLADLGQLAPDPPSPEGKERFPARGDDDPERPWAVLEQPAQQPGRGLVGDGVEGGVALVGQISDVEIGDGYDVEVFLGEFVEHVGEGGEGGGIDGEGAVLELIVDVEVEGVGGDLVFAEAVGNVQVSAYVIIGLLLLLTLPVAAQDAPLPQLIEIFKRGMVAIVMHGHEFQGLITRIDLLNWLRRRL